MATFLPTARTCSSACRPSWRSRFVISFIKGKSAIHAARHFLKQARNYAGQHLWVRRYFVDTEKIRQSIKEQEATDRQLDQLELPITNQNQ